MGLAVIAGLISFLSPCVLPLVPSYLGVLGGGRTPLWRALGFVAGFSLVFVALGASASALGELLRTQQAWLERASGLLVLFFGLIMLGVIRLPALMGDYRAGLGAASRYGPVALGAAFAFGWSPCIGPVLGSILGLAASRGSLGQGVLLLAAYALGLAVPFLLAALLWQRVNLGRLNRYTPWVERAGGVLLVLLGLLLVSGQFARLNAFFFSITPEWLVRLL